MSYTLLTGILIKYEGTFLIRIISLPLFISGFLSLIFFLFSFLFIFHLKREHPFYQSLWIFHIIALVNSVYILSFAIFLNSSSNLFLLNIFNRLTIVSAMFVIISFIHFVRVFFGYTNEIITWFFNIATVLFSVLCLLETPFFLYSGFNQTSKYYIALKFGLLFKVWGVFMIFELIYSAINLIIGFIKERENDIQKKRLLILFIFSTLWISVGLADTLTAIQVIDLPPVSWVGSFSLVISLGLIILSESDRIKTQLQKISILEHLADHDTLTELANRRMLISYMTKAIAYSKRNNYTFSILYLDLDDFKPINDKYGHQYGDYVLKETARRLMSQFRKSDLITRVGGDEFIILALDLKDLDNAQIVKNKIRKAIQEPMVFDGITFLVNASIGIALYPIDGETPDILIQKADQSMYAEKKNISI